MANVRCPMCSKMNPPETEVCSYCGARLKPVRPPSSAPASAPKQSEPEWLRGLTGASPQPEEGASGKPSEKPSGKAPEAASGKPSGEPAPSKPAQSSDSGTPDWLSRIRERAQTDTGSFQAQTPEESPETPDWLKGIDQESGSSTFDDSFGLGNDWMNRLQNPLETTEKPAAPSQPENSSPFGDFDLAGGNEQPDWMRNLSDETPSAESGMDWAMDGDAAPFAGSGTGEGDQEDWMKNLSSWTSEPPAGEGQQTEWKPDQSVPQKPAEPTSSAGGLDDMSWLDSLKPGSQGPASQNVEETPLGKGQVPGGTGLTGFLASLNEPEAAQPGTPDFDSDFQSWEPPTAEKKSAEAFPGWPAEELSEPAPAEPQAGAESDIASWLRSFDSETPSTPAEQQFSTESQQPEESSTGIPDWLNSAPSEAQETPEAGLAQEGGLPSWLSGDFGAAEPPSAKPPARPEAESGLPGWLSGMQETPAESQPEAPAEEPGAEPGGLPAWLSSNAGQEQPPVGESAAFPAEESTPFEGLPGWLSRAEETSAGEQAAFELPEAEGDLWSAGLPAASEQSEPAAEQPAAEGLPAAEPDWLSGFQQAGTIEESPVEPAEAPAQAFTMDSGETPDWMSEFNAQPPASTPVSPVIGNQQGTGTPPGEGAASPFAVDLPDWLGEEAPAQPAETAEHPGEPVNENLAQAELPDWVMKMRPLESVIPGESLPAEADQRVEKAGPLAGMRGVLPAEEMVTRYRKPPIYSAKLRVTEKQRSQATLLDSILGQETQPLLVPPERSQAPRVILQIVLALVLALGVLFPLLPNFALTPSQPALYPNELRNMFEELNKSVQSDKPVLLAVDYEPGYAGEMRLAASAVVDQLMTKNARIVIMSTAPTGPALADALLRETAQNHPSYSLQNQVVDLGYLPGGTISLIEFAGYPRLAAPVTPDAGQSPWNNALKDIQTVANFSQVIVLTDTAETGRAWVEQVGPALNNVPLYMVASAQAAPMLIPYWESGQIKGMVTGLMGGAMYSWPQNQTNSQARQYYGAYQVGVLLGTALIVIGAVTSAGMALMKRRSKDEA